MTMNTSRAMFDMMTHFEEPWFYTDGPFRYWGLERPMYGYYNTPFPTHPLDTLGAGTRVMFRRVARHNVPHDAFGDTVGVADNAPLNRFTMPRRLENEVNTGKIMPDGTIVFD